MEKKLYEICIRGEDSGCYKRYLTDHEYELIRDIYLMTVHIIAVLYIWLKITRIKCEIYNKLTVKSC